MMYDMPNGWTCCSCGDEYPKDFIGEHIAFYDNGTYCKQCEESIEYDNSFNFSYAEIERIIT